MTYREMWETYVEPILETQKKYQSNGVAPEMPQDDGPMTLDRKVAECQAAAIVFGMDPLEAGKAARKSWPPKPEDIEDIRQKLLARERGERK